MEGCPRKLIAAVTVAVVVRAVQVIENAEEPAE